MAGGFDVDWVSRAVRLHFGNLPKGASRPLTSPLTLDHFCGSMTLRRDEGKKVSFIIGFPTFGFSHPNRVALGVLRNHLSSRDTSRFGRSLDEQAYGYSSTDGLWFFEDVGYLRFDFSMFPEKVVPALKIIAAEFDSVRNTLLEHEDFTDAIENLRIGARMRFRDPLRTAVFYAQQWVNLRTVVPLASYERELHRVTRQRVLAVARQILQPQRMIFIARGAVKRFRKAELRLALSTYTNPRPS